MINPVDEGMAALCIDPTCPLISIQSLEYNELGEKERVQEELKVPTRQPIWKPLGK